MLPSVRRPLRLATAIALAAGAFSASVLSVGAAGAATLTPAASIVPSRGVLFGATDTDVPFADFEASVGRKFDLHRDYDLWDNKQPSTDVRWNVSTGHTPLVSILPKRSDGSMLRWPDLAAGQYDADITAQANGLKSVGAPVILAFHHEPENDVTDYGTPAEYAAAFRHYVTVFRAAGASNVGFAYVLMRGSFGNGKADAFYPGDDVIDWIGADSYNWYQCRQNAWRSFAEVNNDLHAWAANHPDKPVVIAEYASGEDAADPNRKGQWFRDALTTVKTWPQLKAVAYFNHDTHPYDLTDSCGFRLDTSAASMDGFRALANDPTIQPNYTSTPAPVAVTGTTSDVTGSTVALHGTVDPKGGAVNYSFQWGLTDSYGSASPAAPVASLTGLVPVAAAVASLKPVTTYHYRVVVTSSAGTSAGADQSFTTGATPGVVTRPATAITTNSATVTGTVDPNTLATTYSFQWGTGTAYGNSTPVGSAGSGDRQIPVNAVIPALVANVNYHYRVVATNAAGTTNGADRIVSIAGAPVVSTGAASLITATGASIKGTVDANLLTTSYWFEYGTDTTYDSRTPLADGGNLTKAVTRLATVTGLKSGTLVHYRIVASNSAGTTYGADRYFKTL